MLVKHMATFLFIPVGLVYLLGLPSDNVVPAA